MKNRGEAIVMAVVIAAVIGAAIILPPASKAIKSVLPDSLKADLSSVTAHAAGKCAGDNPAHECIDRVADPLTVSSDSAIKL